MGFNFRKSINFGPLRINLSKSGVGFSLGVKGFRVSRSAKGKHKATISLPGTGLSYTQNLDKLPGDLSELKDKATALLKGNEEEAEQAETKKSASKSTSSSKTSAKSASASTAKKATASAAKKSTKKAEEAEAPKKTTKKTTSKKTEE